MRKQKAKLGTLLGSNMGSGTRCLIDTFPIFISYYFVIFAQIHNLQQSYECHLCVLRHRTRISGAKNAVFRRCRVSYPAVVLRKFQRIEVCSYICSLAFLRRNSEDSSSSKLPRLRSRFICGNFAAPLSYSGNSDILSTGIEFSVFPLPFQWLSIDLQNVCPASS